MTRSTKKQQVLTDASPPTQISTRDAVETAIGLSKERGAKWDRPADESAKAGKWGKHRKAQIDQSR